jgi:hypothetical protein
MARRRQLFFGDRSGRTNFPATGFPLSNQAIFPAKVSSSGVDCRRYHCGQKVFRLVKTAGRNDSQFNLTGKFLIHAMVHERPQPTSAADNACPNGRRN